MTLNIVEHQLKSHRIPSWKINAQPGRRTISDGQTSDGRTLKSGLTAVRWLKAAGYRAPIWIIELGSNDLDGLSRCHCDQVALARAEIDTVVRSLGRSVFIGWVTVRYPHRASAAYAWNLALRHAADADPRMFLVDWHQASAGHPSWIPDGIHPSLTGAIRLADFIATAIELSLPRVTTPATTIALPTPPEPVGDAKSVDADAQPLRSAVRLQTPVPLVGGPTIADRCGTLRVSVGARSTRAAVRTVQCALTEAGLQPGKANGYYGSFTAIAAAAMRAYLGLPPGVGVDSEVARALGIWRYP
jgi:lysophospholipase L1-like esterase